MIQQLKQIVQHSSIYGISNILNKALAIILIPLYTHYLNVAEYGNLEIFLVTLNFLILSLPLGLHTAIFAFTISFEKNNPRDVISTAFNFLFLFIGGICLCLYLLSPHISFFISNNAQASWFLQLVVLDVFFSCLRLLSLARLRIENKSILYSILNTVKFALNLLLTIVFVVLLKKGVEGILLAGLYSSILSTLISILVIRKDLVIKKISWRLLKKMLGFGVPLVPSAIAGAILVMSNRFFLQECSTSEQLGLFTLGFKYASIITFLTLAFQTAWPTFLFSIAKNPNAKQIYKKLLTYYLYILFFVFLIISILSQDIIRLVSPVEFHDAYRVVPFIVLSHIFYGTYFMTSVGVNIKRKTQYLPFVVGFAACLSLVLNYLFIPTMGMMGAAYASFISYLLLVLFSTKLSLYFYSINYEYGRLIKLLCITVSIYWISSFIRVENIVVSFFLKILLICSYPFLLYILRFYFDKELTNLKELFLSRSFLKEKVILNKYDQDII